MDNMIPGIYFKIFHQTQKAGEERRREEGGGGRERKKDGVEEWRINKWKIETVGTRLTE